MGFDVSQQHQIAHEDMRIIVPERNELNTVLRITCYPS